VGAVVVLVLVMAGVACFSVSSVAEAATADSFRFPLGSGTSSTTYPITQNYCENRIDDDGAPHLGVDWGAPAGTTIVAAANGTVVDRRADPNDSRYGNMVYIKHTLPSGAVRYALYAHMQEPPAVGNGITVRKGQTLGRVGATGYVVGGAHLHFAISSSSGIPPGYGSPCPGAGGTESPIAFVKARMRSASNDTIGTYDEGRFYLRNSNTAGRTSIALQLRPRHPDRRRLGWPVTTTSSMGATVRSIPPTSRDEGRAALSRPTSITPPGGVRLLVVTGHVRPQLALELGKASAKGLLCG
jgi:murein DD-endopeptidase MepM/ murein hydrolase activator NlpD